MTAEPFDTEAYWLGRERDEEYWRGEDTTPPTPEFINPRLRSNP